MLFVFLFVAPLFKLYIYIFMSILLPMHSISPVETLSHAFYLSLVYSYVSDLKSIWSNTTEFIFFSFDDGFNI